MKRTSFAFVCTASLVMCSLGPSVLSPLTAHAATQSLLMLGSTGSSVVTLQKKLNSLGFSCGTADGIFGCKTLAAVKKFQSAKHLTVDGIVGPQTEAALNSAKTTTSTTKTGSSTSTTISSTPTLADGSTGTAVKTLQTVLNQLGFSVGIVDGVFGPKTLSAVKAFQKSRKLTVDGIVGPQTWSALKQALLSSSASVSTSSRSSSPSSTTASSSSKSSTSSSSGSSSGSSSSSTATTAAPAYPNEILEDGSTGSAVEEIQTQLNKLGYSCGAVDGDFEPETLAAVEAFQKAKNLTVDGEVGPETWDALFDITTPTTTSSSTSSSSSSESSDSGGAFTNVDLRFPAPSDITASSLNNYLKLTGSPLNGLGESFMTAQSTYSVDATYLVAHAIEESASGTSQIALADNNLFGYGAYDSAPSADAGLFPSDDYAIRFEAWEVQNNYLSTTGSNYGGSPTLTGMNVHYATDPDWASNIGAIMGQIASSVGSSASAYTMYSQSNTAPVPASDAEPVYFLNGATGTTASNSTYDGVPYYGDQATGEANMFVSPLSNGSSGSGVDLVQQYLNSVDNAGLTVDGEFGPLTEAAVDNFEKAHGLTQNGVWSASMWQKYILSNKSNDVPVIPAGTTVHVEEIAQGMAGGYVTPWYLLQGYGWVDGADVSFTNVYRLSTIGAETATNTSIPVYQSDDGKTQIATLHAGDFVVANSTTAVKGFYKIQFAAQTNGASYGSQPMGTPLTGYVSASAVSLTVQH